MSGTASTIESAAAKVARGFESIPSRLKAIGEHIAEAMAHPFTPPGVRIGLPMLLEVVEDLRQEVAELRKPCPCNPAPTAATVAEPASAPAADPTATPTATATEAAHLTAEEIDARVAAFRASLG